MPTPWIRPLLAALALGVLYGSATAQVIVRTPFVNVFVPGKPPAVPPPLLVEPGAPPAVPVVPVVPGAAPTLADFAATFAPPACGGRCDVVVLHPCTCCPVKVSLCLPPRCPRKIRATKNTLEIRYGPFKAVTVCFLPDGSVRVRD